MNDPDSDFVNFLRDTCTPDKEELDGGDVETDHDHDESNPHISLFHFRCIGLLWCEGSTKEKAFEYYDML